MGQAGHLPLVQVLHGGVPHLGLADGPGEQSVFQVQVLLGHGGLLGQPLLQVQGLHGGVPPP